MKTLIVYYSRTGLTKKVALKLGAELSADTEEIIDKKDRSGALGYMLSGREALKKTLAEIEAPKINSGDYDLVIIGTPVWAYSMSSAVRTYLTEQSGRLKSVAFFATHGSDGGERAIRLMEELSGQPAKASLVITSKEVTQDNYQAKLKQFIDALKNN